MTDEHGPDSQPAHEEIHEQEHETQPAEAGVWSDDHPPVDDFADAGSANEEAASVSQESSSEADEGTAHSPSSSRSMLPLFAGIGGILLIGAVIYWQFGHSTPQPMMTAPPLAPKSASSLASNTRPPGASSGSGKAEEADITSLYKPASEAAALSPTTSETPTTAMAPPEAAPAPTPPANAAIPAPVPAATNPGSITPLPSGMPGVAPAMLPPPSAPAAMAPPPSPAANARIDGLAARMDGLQKSIETTTQQLNQISTMVAANQVMPPASNQVSPALEDRLNKIEQSLLQIEHNETAKVQPPSAAKPAEAEADTGATSEVVTKKVSHHARSSKPKAAHKKTVHHAMPSAPAETARASSSWVLRAATPTEAWVAADARSAELRHVQIGDSLPGVGQIRSIRQTPSGWEIEGASGTIR